MHSLRVMCYAYHCLKYVPQLNAMGCRGSRWLSAFVSRANGKMRVARHVSTTARRFFRILYRLLYLSAVYFNSYYRLSLAVISKKLTRMRMNWDWGVEVTLSGVLYKNQMINKKKLLHNETTNQLTRGTHLHR